jgi:hypothetical protein
MAFQHGTLPFVTANNVVKTISSHPNIVANTTNWYSQANSASHTLSFSSGVK